MYSETQVMERGYPPSYEPPPPWIPPQQRYGNPDYDNDLLGFNVRGGDPTVPGMFITNVSPDSEADRLGVREGDQIMEVNGISFEKIDHVEAVGVLKSSLEVYMTLRFFPYMYRKVLEKKKTASSSSHHNDK